jgi:CDP-diacylglycerol--glycerol-3-phosphate 3-phosphatidyltransferase
MKFFICASICRDDIQFSTHVHMDYLRGTRCGSNGISPASIMRPLISNGLKLSFYRTPQLHSVNELLIPSRLKETIGLSHFKVAVFDDTVLITGANLSHQYFVNRVDRYMCVQDHPDIANYYWSLLQTIDEISYKLEPLKDIHENCNSISYLHHPLVFKPPSIDISNANTLLNAFITSQIQKSKELLTCNDSYYSTYLVPTLQMAPLGVHQDEKALTTTLSFVHQSLPNASIYLATGYFNPVDSFRKIFSM